MRHALVIGAGIGGLAAAAGLRRIGWRVTVLEQSARLGEVGAGVTLWPNALNALAALGFGDLLEDLQRQPFDGSLYDPHGRLLARIDQTRLRAELGRPAVAMHRAQLHRMLVPAAGDVRTGVRVTEVRPDGALPGIDPGLPAADLPVADLPAADLVVGADGIDSRVRTAGWPDAAPATYTGYTAWRGVCDPADLSSRTARLVRETAGITWGRGQEFGLVPLVDGRIYWYAAMPAPQGQRNADERAAVRREFDWHRPLPEVVDATPPERVLRNDLRHLAKPLSTYRSGRRVLLGDAAHAMMPGLGQGACQALEDAAVLAYACATYPDLDQALRWYDAERRPRSQRIARMSWQASRYGPLLRNPLLTGLRDLGMRLLPSSVLARGMMATSTWHPPAPLS